MQRSYDIIMRLTDPHLPPSARKETLKRFADENEWLPSDEIDGYPGTEEFANGHLVVEHGLDNTAVITFLKRGRGFGHLDQDDRIRLLSISYNNLVDWHLFPDLNGLTRVFNRLKSISEATRYISVNEEADVWRADAFDRVVGRRPNPNVKSLDDALMDTISFWKRALVGELGGQVRNENISALFNSLIFARALEDENRRRTPNSKQLLVEKWVSRRNRTKSIRACIRACITDMGTGAIPKGLHEEDKLTVFDNLDHETVVSIFRDFYINRFAKYHYDFSVMTKHALSRIFEHYVSLVSRAESPQLTFFPDLPEEVADQTFGGIYTPQYIARFFARYLKENLTPAAFRSLKTTDPACGSGIFLRTILEMQCDPLQEIDMREPTRKAFENILGIDINENACQLARLSLYLLHRALTDTFPEALGIVHSEAIDFFRRNAALANSFDVVIANPPFIKWEKMDEPDRVRVAECMADYGKGKADAYLAFLKLGMELLKEGGNLLYVLPHSFLIAENARKLRKEIATGYWVRFVVDLSEIDVFQGVGSYVILLVIQKKLPIDAGRTRTVVVRCKKFPGLALQAALEGKRYSTDLNEIYETDQETFTGEQWQILAPTQLTLMAKLSKHPTLDEFLSVRVGFNTGANRIFIRLISEVPTAERGVYIPYLQDREMEKYVIPGKTREVVFYPYVEGKKIKEGELKSEDPRTWSYLREHKASLAARRAVVKGECDWWSPERARLPEHMLRPKIVSPHLVLLPKFSLDKTGRYGISRAPLMYLKVQEGGIDLLCYFLAVLNSAPVFWQIAGLSQKYSRGYFMLEPKTLKKLHVPDPSSVSAPAMQKVQNLVKKRVESNDPSVEAEIERVCTGSA